MPPHEGEQSGDRELELELPGQSFGTYDEVSMQHSHNFLTALQELKNLRPQLYSAAEYCESSYLYSNQKQVVLENLKDYSVKALVNAVDHLGTVAFKLNDLLSQQASEVASADIRAGSLAQRLRSCQEHSDREGLKQQSLAKSTQANHKHYVLPDVTEFSKRAYDQDLVTMSRETFDLEQVQSQAQASDGSGSSRSLAWHFAVDRSPVKTSSSSTLHQPSSSRYLASPLRDADGSVSRDSDSSNTSAGPLLISDRSKHNSRSRSAERVRAEDRSRTMEKRQSSDKRIPGRSKSTERRPLAKVSTSNAQVPSLERSVSQLNLSDTDRDSRAPSRSKSLLRSLLSRGKNDEMGDVYERLFIRVSPAP
ncbi:unnamed protein product [Calypogeia fissa]